MRGPVAVIITARNAEATIGDAVLSALDQPEVAEVVVVDDASTDATSAAARAAAQGDGRLILMPQAANIGPAAARNLAIARSTAPFIAILDADDWFLPGRFSALLPETDWDLIADNIVFIPDGTAGLPRPPVGPMESEPLDLAAFVRGNIARRGESRGELGFLKPVIRRSILANGPYDPALWLGEDYDLYVRLLLAGARFRVSHRVGYAARVRANSLSGQHRTGDLLALLRATARHRAAPGLSPDAAAAMRDHQRQLSARYLLREFLDRKAAQGAGAALAFALAPPTNLAPIARGILADKLAWMRRSMPTGDVRTLLPVQGGGPPSGTNPAAQAPAASSATGDR